MTKLALELSLPAKPSLSGGGAAAPSGLLLDGYTVGVAYSLRKLRTAYGGNCVRIRRSSDNAEQTFGFVSDVVDTAGIATFIGGGTGFCTIYYDQSGNALDLSNGTADQQLTYLASGVNGKPAFSFDGLGDCLIRNSVPSLTVFAASEVAFMSVIVQSGASANNGLFEINVAGSPPLMACYATYDNTLYFDFVNGGSGRINVAQPSGWDDVPHVLELTRTTAGAQLIITDGTTRLSTSGHLDAMTSATQTIIFGTATLASFAGKIADFFILKTEPGAAARSTLRADMGAYYGITVA